MGLRNKVIIITFSLSILTALLCCKSKSVLNKVSAIKTSDSLVEHPYWVDMMDDPNVNYYKAIAAFNTYWEHREKPTEDDGEGQDIFNREKTKEKNKEDKVAKQSDYTYEYKQFLNWQLRNRNYVKPDGTIMTQQEILEQSEKEKRAR